MTIEYNFSEEDIKEALHEKFLDKDKKYIITLNIIKTENVYGEEYNAIVAKATPCDYNTPFDN